MKLNNHTTPNVVKGPWRMSAEDDEDSKSFGLIHLLAIIFVFLLGLVIL